MFAPCHPFLTQLFRFPPACCFEKIDYAINNAPAPTAYDGDEVVEIIFHDQDQSVCVCVCVCVFFLNKKLLWFFLRSNEHTHKHTPTHRGHDACLGLRNV